MKSFRTSTRRLRLLAFGLAGSIAVAALLAILAPAIIRAGSRPLWTNLNALLPAFQGARPGSGQREQIGPGPVDRSAQASLGASGVTGWTGGFTASGGAVHPEQGGGDGRFDPALPSGADAFLLAALDRLEQQVAAAMAHARESVVALEYTAADAPSGTRRIATGIVINQRGEMLSVKIDPVISGEPAGTGERSLPILARDYSGRRHVAHWIAADPETGLTLLQVAPRAVRPIRVATDGPNLGGQIFVLGNPFGMGHSVSRGHIAGLDWAMELPDCQLGGMIQVQAPLYPGDSGAAVVNLRGDLLGLIRSGLAIPHSHSAIRSSSSREIGEAAPSFSADQPPLWPAAADSVDRLDQAERDNDFGFAISARDALWVADHLRAYGRVDRAYLGVRLEGASDDLPGAPSPPATARGQRHANRQDPLAIATPDSPSDQRLEPCAGAVLVEVLAGTPAAESGLRIGDRIVSVDGRSIQSAHDLTDRLDRMPARATIQLGVIRGIAPRRERTFVSLRTASRPTRQQLARFEATTPRAAPASTGTSAPSAPLTVMTASKSSPPTASLSRYGAPAKPASHLNPSLPANPPHGESAAPPAPGLRPNDLQLTLPRAVVERLEQLERRLEKLESPAPGVKALSGKHDPQIGSVRSP